MKCVVMCIGNRYNGDDGVGTYIAKRLNGKKEEMVVLDCATTPENYLGKIKYLKPDSLLIIDAAEMGLKPGEIRIVPKELINSTYFSTHNIPISLLINYLEKYIKDIKFIGIQPKKLHGKLSNVVKNSADRVIEMLMKGDLSQIN